ncbi:MAG: hypothetical protein ACO3A2_09805, partial [Bdellovibrionia bacterium]
MEILGQSDPSPSWDEHEKSFFNPCDPDPCWLLEQEGFDPSREREMETLFSLGNGRLGIRGSSDLLIPTSQADLLISGIYDQKAITLPYSGREWVTPRLREGMETEIVPFPSPFLWQAQLSETVLSRENQTLVESKRTLDLRKAILYEQQILLDLKGRRTRMRSLRLCSQASHSCLIQKIELTAENYSAVVTLQFPLYPEPFDQNYPHLILKNKTFENARRQVTFETRGSKKTLVMEHLTLDPFELLKTENLVQILCPGKPIQICRIITLRSELTYPRSQVQLVPR